MLSLPYQSYVAWRTVVTLIHAVAILSTLVRICTRYKNRQMWLDDYLVLIPTAADLVLCISPWALPSLTRDPRVLGHYDLRKFWALLLLCYIIIWSSRICFMLSLGRLFPSGSLTRSRITSLIILFALLFCCAVVLLAFHCDPLNPVARHCVKFLSSDPVTKYTFAVDAFCDVIMTVTPQVVLWKIKLSRLEKRVILTALSGGIVTLLLFALLMFFTFAPFDQTTLPFTILTSMLSNLLTAASLISCNALIVVTNIFRVYRRRVGNAGEAGSSSSTSDDSSSPTRPSSSSAPACDVEKTKKNADPRSRQVPYGLDTKSDGATDSEGSTAPLSMFTLTQITMDDYDSRYGSSNSTNPQARLSELPVSSAGTTTVPDIT